MSLKKKELAESKKGKEEDVIKQLERRTGRKLERFKIEDIPQPRSKINGYAVDEEGHIIGLNLYDSNISSNLACPQIRTVH